MTRLLAPLIVAMAIGLGLSAPQAAAQDKVIYHFDDSEEQALRALRSMRNHLDVKPETEIMAVAHADGVDFLFEGAAHSTGVAYAPLISDLIARGARFEVCELTMELRDLEPADFILEAEYVRSGVVRIVELQQGQGFGYIKP